MSRLLVVHMDLGSKGGGEAVAMNVIEALQPDHDVTLLTLTDPDVDELNAYFNTTVDPDALTVRRAGRLARTIHERFGVRYYVLQNALLARNARAIAPAFDRCLSTINEFGLPGPAVEYVHFPFDWELRLDNRGDIFHPSIEGDSVYERVCRRVADVTAERVRTSRVLANSEWTADAVEAAYGDRPRVLTPPIDTAEFTDRPWADREPGFVAVGRIERSKRVAELVRIVDGVRERGHDVHLHVVGPTYDADYAAEVEALAEERPHVHLEGELPRGELVDLLCSHRFGLHGKRHEHFGMAVAEQAAAGAIPFLPDSGGQRTIVDGDARLLYRSADEAVEKIDRVLSEPALQRELRPEPERIEARFGRERFQREIRAEVAASLDRPAPESATRVPVEDAPSIDD